MTTKKKTFDCVEMKRQIQEKILRDFEGLNPEQQRELTRKRIEADPILGPIWRRGLQIKKAEENRSK